MLPYNTNIFTQPNILVIVLFFFFSPVFVKLVDFHSSVSLFNQVKSLNDTVTVRINLHSNTY